MKVSRIFQIATIFTGLTLAGVSGAYAQGRFTPEQRIQMRMDKLKSELNLSDQQVTKIKPIVASSQQKMMKLRNSGGDPASLKTQRKAIMTDTDKQISEQLTPEQAKKFENMKQQMRGNGMRQKRGMQQPVN